MLEETLKLPKTTIPQQNENSENKNLPPTISQNCRLLFHKNDYSDEFTDTNYYKQNRITTLNST